MKKFIAIACILSFFSCKKEEPLNHLYEVKIQLDQRASSVLLVEFMNKEKFVLTTDSIAYSDTLVYSYHSPKPRYFNINAPKFKTIGMISIYYSVDGIKQLAPGQHALYDLYYIRENNKDSAFYREYFN